MSVVEEPAAAGVSPPPLRRNRDFLLLWTGAAVTQIGARVTAIAYPLLVLWYTGSVSKAGLVGSAALLPHLLVQLPAGAFVDRWDRRRLMIFCDAGCLAVTASVAVAVYLDRIWLPHLMAVAFVQTSLAIFYQLAERAAVRNLVPREQLATALTQNETRSRAAVLLGQPAGGLLFTVARWVPFLFTSLAHLASLVALLLIRREFQQARPRERRSLAAEIGEGIRWMWEQRFLRTVMGFIAVSNVAFQGLTLALMLIVRDSGRSAAVVGLVIGVSGVGGMLGALTGTWWMRRATLRSLVIGGLTAWMLTMPAVAFTSDPIVLCALFAANSYVGGLFNLVGGVYMVRITPDAVMGRVGGVATLLASGTNFLGVLAGGFLLAALGVRSTVLWLSVVMALLVVLSVVSPSVRSIAGTSQNRLMSRPGADAAAAASPAEPQPDGRSIEKV